jgi:hypothetical protein
MSQGSLPSVPHSADRCHPGGIRLRYAAPLAFFLAFGFAVWRSCPNIAGQLLEIPNLPSLCQAEDPRWPVAIDSYLLREGDSDWPSGGRLFILPDAVRLLPEKGLFGYWHAAARANERGAGGPDQDRRARGYVLSAAASWAADWWRLQFKQPLNEYDSKISGGIEFGVSPLALAAVYEDRSEANPGMFPLSGPDDLDPLTGRRFPVSIEGMARLLGEFARPAGSEPIALEVSPDGWPGKEVLRSADMAMTDPPLQVWPARSDDSETLSRALRHYGILRAGLKEQRSETPGAENFNQGAAAVIGDYELNGRRLFLLRFPMTLLLPGDQGYTEFAFVPAEAISEAWAFPHPLKAEWKWTGKGVSQLSVSDPFGNGVAVNPGKELRLEFDGSVQALRRGALTIRPAGQTRAENLRLSFTCRFFMPPPGAMDGGAVRLALPEYSGAEAGRNASPEAP